MAIPIKTERFFFLFKVVTSQRPFASSFVRFVSNLLMQIVVSIIVRPKVGLEGPSSSISDNILHAWSLTKIKF